MHSSLIKYLNNPKRTTILFFIFAIIGLLSTVFFKPLLGKSHYQAGPETIGLFIPAFFSAVFLLLMGSLHNFTIRTLWITLSLLLIQYIPLGHLLFKVVEPNKGIDFSRYFLYAQNMIENKTLWGGDQLIYPNDSRAYITQPGYRYFVALELLIFQKLYRFVSIVNIGIFIAACYFLLKIIHIKIEQTKLKFILSGIVISSIPYATKNILMGLPEWLTIVLLIFFTWFYIIKKQPLTAFIILAFVPFLRQNLLPPVVIMLFIYSIIENMDRRIIVSFLLIIFLPLYHNLYYANEFSFFAVIVQWPFLEYGLSGPTSFDIFQPINNIMHYTGFDFNNDRIDFIEEGVLMLIGFSITYFLLGKYIENKAARKWFYALTFFSLIIPTIFMGTEFYPRFEFVVIYFTIVMFLQFKTIHTTVRLPC
jgi:hypothetical protein